VYEDRASRNLQLAKQNRLDELYRERTNEQEQNVRDILRYANRPQLTQKQRLMMAQGDELAENFLNKYKEGVVININAEDFAGRYALVQILKDTTFKADLLQCLKRKDCNSIVKNISGVDKNIDLSKITEALEKSQGLKRNPELIEIMNALASV
jgi:hypothetical protein